MKSRRIVMVWAILIVGSAAAGPAIVPANGGEFPEQSSLVPNTGWRADAPPVVGFLSFSGASRLSLEAQNVRVAGTPDEPASLEGRVALVVETQEGLAAYVVQGDVVWFTIGEDGARIVGNLNFGEDQVKVDILTPGSRAAGHCTITWTYDGQEPASASPPFVVWRTDGTAGVALEMAAEEGCPEFRMRVDLWAPHGAS